MLGKVLSNFALLRIADTIGNSEICELLERRIILNVAETACLNRSSLNSSWHETFRLHGGISHGRVATMPGIGVVCFRE